MNLLTLGKTLSLKEIEEISNAEPLHIGQNIINKILFEFIDLNIQKTNFNKSFINIKFNSNFINFQKLPSEKKVIDENDQGNDILYEV